jgi:hypothetical protein
MGHICTQFGYMKSVERNQLNQWDITWDINQLYIYCIYIHTHTIYCLSWQLIGSHTLKWMNGCPLPYCGLGPLFRNLDGEIDYCNQRIGLGKKLQENPILNGKNHGFLQFSLKPIHWCNQLNFTAG